MVLHEKIEKTITEWYSTTVKTPLTYLFILLLKIIQIWSLVVNHCSKSTFKVSHVESNYLRRFTQEVEGIIVGVGSTWPCVSNIHIGGL
jgi:hypothetical protein